MAITTETAQATVANLDALDAELLKLGWKTRLSVTPGRVPSLHVQNPSPGASALAENIYSAPQGVGWAYWWPWAEPIAESAPEAAAVIVRVLRTTND